MAASLAGHTARPCALGEHITVALIPPVAEQLCWLQENTHLSATDLTNRAITWYAFFAEQMRVGNDLMVRDNWTGETKLVLFVMPRRDKRDTARSAPVPAQAGAGPGGRQGACPPPATA